MPLATCKFSLVFAILLVAVSCKKLDAEGSKNTDAQIVEDVKTVPKYCVKANPLIGHCSERRLALNVFEIKDNLYIVNGMGLAFKSSGAAFYYDKDELDDDRSDDIMTSKIVFQPIEGDDYLEKIIDPMTWRAVYGWYRDNENLYCHHATSDGGRLWHMKSFNPNKMQFLLPDGRTFDVNEVEQMGWKKTHEDIENFVPDYLTDGMRVVDVRCSVKTIEEQKAEWVESERKWNPKNSKKTK